MKNLGSIAATCTIAFITSISLNLWRQATVHALWFNELTHLTAVAGVALLGYMHDARHSWEHYVICIYAILHAISLAISAIAPHEHDAQSACAFASWFTGSGLMTYVLVKSTELTRVPYLGLGMTTVVIGAGRIVIADGNAHKTIIFLVCAGGLMTYTSLRFIFLPRPSNTSEPFHLLCYVKIFIFGVLSWSMEAAGIVAVQEISASKLHVACVYLLYSAASGVGAIFCWVDASSRGLVCASSTLVCMTSVYLACTGETLDAAYVIYTSMGIAKVSLISLIIDGTPHNTVLCFGLVIYIGMLLSQLLLAAVEASTHQLHVEILLIVTSFVCSISVWSLSGYKDCHRLPVLTIARSINQVSSRGSIEQESTPIACTSEPFMMFMHAALQQRKQEKNYHDRTFNKVTAHIAKLMLGK